MFNYVISSHKNNPRFFVECKGYVLLKVKSSVIKCEGESDHGLFEGSVQRSTEQGRKWKMWAVK